MYTESLFRLLLRHAVSRKDHDKMARIYNAHHSLGLKLNKNNSNLGDFHCVDIPPKMWTQKPVTSRAHNSTYWVISPQLSHLFAAIYEGCHNSICN